MPREIPAAELPSTPRLNAIMDRAMAKVKALLYELEMDRGKKHDAERAGEVGVRGRERNRERTKQGRRKDGEGMKRREERRTKTKTGSVDASKSYSSFVFIPPTLR